MLACLGWTLGLSELRRVGDRKCGIRVGWLVKVAVMLELTRRNSGRAGELTQRGSSQLAKISGDHTHRHIDPEPRRSA